MSFKNHFCIKFHWHFLVSHKPCIEPCNCFFWSHSTPKLRSMPLNSEKAPYIASLLTPSPLGTIILFDHFCNFWDKLALRSNQSPLHSLLRPHWNLYKSPSKPQNWSSTNLLKNSIKEAWKFKFLISSNPSSSFFFFFH
jgi:hypothetical protein